METTMENLKAAPEETPAIFSTWGRTTKAMTRAVVRVREEFQQYKGMAASDLPRSLYATKEIFVRYNKCGEIISREMVARVCQHYQDDAEVKWSLIIEQFGGPEEVSPHFQLDPTFLNPRLRHLLDAAE
jgi:hypothetical protein